MVNRCSRVERPRSRYHAAHPRNLLTNEAPMQLVILDRDGVINVDSSDYIRNPNEWHPIPGSLEAIAALHRRDRSVVVATNQAGIGRGLFAPTDLAQIHSKMSTMVDAAGGCIERIFFCPHHPDDDCDCRKPKPGLVRQLETALHISAQGAPFVGDSLRDMQCALAAGCEPVLVLTGNGRKARTEAEALGVRHIFPDLAAAVPTLLALSAHPTPG